MDCVSFATRARWHKSYRPSCNPDHLLKRAYQPQQRARRGASWRRSLYNAREPIEQVLRDRPSLRRALPYALAWAYPRARERAADETGLPLATFPEACPWTLVQLQDSRFWPEV